jgi:hypothetical protein
VLALCLPLILLFIFKNTYELNFFILPCRYEVLRAEFPQDVPAIVLQTLPQLVRTVEEEMYRSVQSKVRNPAFRLTWICFCCWLELSDRTIPSQAEYMDMSTLRNRVLTVVVPRFQERAGQEGQAVGTSSSDGAGNGVFRQGQQGPLFQQVPGYGLADLLSNDLAKLFNMMPPSQN